MKSKKFQKKLSLNKKTVADLNPGAMNGVRGGGTVTSVNVVCIPTALVCTVTCTCPTINTCETYCGTCATNCGTCEPCYTVDISCESICVTSPCQYCFRP
jgi:hypothetical protein